MNKIKRLMGANMTHCEVNDIFPYELLVNLNVGEHYEFTVDGLTFIDSVGTARLVSAFDWALPKLGTFHDTHEHSESHVSDKQMEKAADLHEQETFGPLSSDPLVNPKKAKGAVKAPFHATPELANIQMSNVMAGGGWKYGDFNYHESDVDAQTYLSAMRRHYLLWKDGVDFDDESGQSHLAHVMACCAILIETQATGNLIDNRAKTGLVEQYLKVSSDTFNNYISKVEPIAK